ELVREQLLNALQNSEFILPGEVQAEGKLFTQTRDSRTIQSDLAEFAKNIELTDEEIQEYYKANPDNFTRPEQVKVSYIELSAEALKEQVNVSDAEVKKYYD
ncbi:peptidylprolyl isomerase, partial [Vibrio parahaemolyticus]|uniref:peptidyl-prolyl cis-trans isomerase n=1 Tax=Vibrio parahaemolyticus TaxID=670 RepID=UPI00146C321C